MTSKLLNIKESLRAPSSYRFYRHLESLILRGCQDVRFELRLDGGDSKGFYRLDGKAYNYTGDIYDAYQAIEEMIPNFCFGEFAGNHTRHIHEDGWENAVDIICRYNCMPAENLLTIFLRVSMKNLTLE